MKIKRGQKIKVSSRRGKYSAIASSDFDTKKDKRFNVILDQNNLYGINTKWEKGDIISCISNINAVEKR